MKKLIMFAATALVGLSLSAAQYQWAYDACGEFDPGSTVYLFSGASDIGSTLATVLTDNGVDAFNTALAGYNYVSSTIAPDGTVSGTITGVGATDYATVFVFSDGVTAGKDFAYYSAQDASGNIFTPPQGTPGALELWGDDPYTTLTIKTAGGGGGDVPEPTSALLLVLGGAMLALRRRRA